jgi:exosortase
MPTSAQLSAREDQAGQLRRLPWAGIVWFAALLIVCYAPVLNRLVWQWATDEDLGHGFFVPVVVAWIVWRRRATLMAIPVRPNYWGLALMAWGMAQMLLGAIGAELFLARTAFVISLVGVIVVVCGIPVLRALSFPLFLLLFMIPIPAVIYAQITLPLQLFASSVAAGVLNSMGIPVLQTGNVLELANGQQLSVVEACSGIRSLMSLSFLSLVYAWFFDPKPWMRAALLALTVPIAILANATRVVITGIISANNPKMAEGLFHGVEGAVVFLFALALVVVCHALINRIYRVFHKAKPPEAAHA